MIINNNNEKKEKKTIIPTDPIVLKLSTFLTKNSLIAIFMLQRDGIFLVF